MAEPYKWELSPEITLREFASGRMDDDPGYLKTVCGMHRKLWILVNVDLNGYIPKKKLDEVNAGLEEAFKMGKRMDARLHYYYAEKHGKKGKSQKFMEEVKFNKDGTPIVPEAPHE